MFILTTKVMFAIIFTAMVFMFHTVEDPRKLFLQMQDDI